MRSKQRYAAHEEEVLTYRDNILIFLYIYLYLNYSNLITY